MSAEQPQWTEELELVWFRQIVERAPDAFVVIDSEGRIILVNRQTERLFGYAREELLGKPVEELVPDQLREGHAIARDAYFGEPKVREMGANLDLSGRRKDGTEFPIEISLSPLDTPRGLFAAAAIRDATARRKAQRQFRDLLEAAPDAMVIIDSEGKIALVNAQAVRLFGYQREAMIGRPVEILIPERLRQAHAAHRDHYFGGPKVREMGAGLELSGRRRNGSEFPIEISLSPLETDDGLFATAAVRDISARKQDERKLKEYAQTLEASNVQLEQFASVASHDLQAPLRNIVGFNQLLQRKLAKASTPKDQELFGMVDECARRMQALIDGLLELSRVNRTPLKRKALPVATLVNHAKLQLQSTLDEANAEVHCDSQAEVDGDAALLTQLLQNLIANGIKFQAPGAQPRVTIDSEPSGAARLVLRVQDNGIGIAPDQLESVFKMFRRLHGTEEYPGTGIGLAISQKIVELHDGRIWAESTLGQGTTFFIDLPAA